MECSRCSSEFENVHIDGEDYSICKSCELMVLKKNQLNRLMNESDAEVSSIREYNADQSDPVKCPVCSSRMKRINFLGFSGIMIEHCESCGAFLVDNAEITQMHELVRLVDEGKHTVTEVRAYDLLMRISRLAYSIFSS
ncbi:MAG: zf-TFIIB domain-containing protein [Spirochaetes bacterium]|nr:zf-TFIIB domain-containing protein [Spirochaetota bacterium]